MGSILSSEFGMWQPPSDPLVGSLPRIKLVKKSFPHGAVGGKIVSNNNMGDNMGVVGGKLELDDSIGAVGGKSIWVPNKNLGEDE